MSFSVVPSTHTLSFALGIGRRVMSESRIAAWTWRSVLINPRSATKSRSGRGPCLDSQRLLTEAFGLASVLGQRFGIESPGAKKEAAMSPLREPFQADLVRVGEMRADVV